MLYQMKLDLKFMIPSSFSTLKTFLFCCNRMLDIKIGYIEKLDTYVSDTILLHPDAFVFCCYMCLLHTWKEMQKMCIKRNMICRPHFKTYLTSSACIEEKNLYIFIINIINSFLATRGLTKTRNKAELKWYYRK